MSGRESRFGFLVDLGTHHSAKSTNRQFRNVRTGAVRIPIGHGPIFQRKKIAFTQRRSAVRICLGLRIIQTNIGEIPMDIVTILLIVLIVVVLVSWLRR
jgi:hypothetical protein